MPNGREAYVLKLPKVSMRIYHVYMPNTTTYLHLFGIATKVEYRSISVLLARTM
jgi:hypothetical protein